MRKRLDLTGKTFGKWYVKSFSHTDKRAASFYNCICECTAECIVLGLNLTHNRSKSCRSCSSFKHGLSGHVAYPTWAAMMARCNNTKGKDFCRYGRKGIRVCKEWHDVKVFVTWAESNEFKKGLEIHRLDSDKNYCPENCVFLCKSDHAGLQSKDTIQIHKDKAIRFLEYPNEFRLWLGKKLGIEISQQLVGPLGNQHGTTRKKKSSVLNMPQPASQMTLWPS